MNLNEFFSLRNGSYSNKSKPKKSQFLKEVLSNLLRMRIPFIKKQKKGNYSLNYWSLKLN